MLIFRHKAIKGYKAWVIIERIGSEYYCRKIVKVSVNNKIIQIL